MFKGRAIWFNTGVVFLCVLFVIICLEGLEKCQADKSKLIYFCLSGLSAFVFLITNYFMERELLKHKDVKDLVIGSSSGGFLLLAMTWLYFKDKKSDGQRLGLKFYLSLISIIGAITLFILVFV